MLSDEKAGDLPVSWQWPGLWSVNLPILVVLWHVLLAQSFHVWLNSYHFFATAALAWVFVATERWIYFFRLRQELAREVLSGDLPEQRAAMVRLCLLILGGLILTAVFRANTREVAGMLVWTSLGGGYLVAVRLIPRETGAFIPREMALAGYLAGSASLFTWANGAFSPMRLLLPAFLLLLLFFYYFCVVSSWSKPLLPARPNGSLLEGPARGFYRIVPLLLIIAAACLVFLDPDAGSDPLFVAIATAAGILLVLDFRHRSVTPNAARMLADAALLAPVVPLLVDWL